MHRTVCFALVASSLVLASLTGCSAPASEESVAAPPPNDPLVFEASGDTKADVGVAKWGYGNDPDKGTTTFHGYDEKNQLVVTVLQVLDQSDPMNVHYAMSMTGKATASEKIDFGARIIDDGKNTELSMNVIENTFDEGSVAARLLQHFGTDAKTAAAATSGQSTLVGQSHPLAGQQLVTCGNQAVQPCMNELIDSRIAAAGAATDCSLTRRVGYPLVATVAGALIGGFFTLETGPGAVVGAAAGAASGAVGFGLAGHQCATSQADANAAAQKLRQCQQQAARAQQGQQCSQ